MILLKTIELKLTHANAYYEIAYAYEEIGYIKEAIESYKKFIFYSPPENYQIIEIAKNRIQILENFN